MYKYYTNKCCDDDDDDSYRFYSLENGVDVGDIQVNVHSACHFVSMSKLR